MAHVGSGVWGIWDGGVTSWRATDLAEDDATQQAPYRDTPDWSSARPRRSPRSSTTRTRTVFTSRQGVSFGCR